MDHRNRRHSMGPEHRRRSHHNHTGCSAICGAFSAAAADDAGADGYVPNRSNALRLRPNPALNSIQPPLRREPLGLHPTTSVCVDLVLRQLIHQNPQSSKSS